ncbi:vacuolar protein sorting-associated protein 33A isoform X1 [Lethenteron reissneri]|uniref:vacuolar protein sorting-associated protein 33A isoform X1 n=1 Tax=Lethenteron reissneri TaxID=7753 RepID=UPI002AB7A22A|nr:vacuolar protein sorting-associated protein 33A isoform X1 [Lethenteron reissneri]
MASHLASGRLNLGVLREAARRRLLQILDKLSGSKAIVWDESLTGPFGLIAEYSLLKEHEVDKMFPLREERLPPLPPSPSRHVIFMLRPRVELMQIVGTSLLKEEGCSPGREYHLVCVPRRCVLCEQHLQQMGVFGTFTTIQEYPLDFIPFDSDLISMENEFAFRECHLENDFTSLFHVAKGLMTMQSLYGTIPNISGKGEWARRVTDMLLRMHREMAGVQMHMPPAIDTLLIIDRSVDLLTPMLTQLTYEGLVDEIYGLQNTSVKLPPEKFQPRKQDGEAAAELPSEPKKLILNSAEELYAEIRDRNFNAVGEVLSRKARLITAQFEERHQAKTVGEIKEFVSKLPHMQAVKSSLATHTSIAELVQEVTHSDTFLDSLAVEQEFIAGIDTDKANVYIEECIAQKLPLMRVLRLMCIQSLCNNGLKPKLLEYYRREIIQTYGFEHMLTLFNLEKAGLLKLQPPGRNNFPTLRKTLRLHQTDVNERAPTDVSYVYSGYAPLSVRLAQLSTRPGWRVIEEALKLLPGPEFHEKQPIPTGLAHKRDTGSRITLVLFLGGVTSAEISAIRFLGQSEDSNTDYVIGTTKLINGTSWLQSLAEKLEPITTCPAK